jgi:hypothetical protein
LVKGHHDATQKGGIVVTLSGKVKNTSVRARSDSDDTFRGCPFKGIGNSREKVRFGLVKVTILAVFDRKLYQKLLFLLFFILKIFRFWGSFGEEFLPIIQFLPFF